MQILEIDWQRFLDDLLPFQQLPLAARRQFLEKVRPSQPISSLELGESFEVLCASGFLLMGVRGKNATVPQKHRAFCRVMRALYRHRVFDSTSRDKFHAYLADHFTGGERGVLYSFGGNYYYGEQTLYSRVTSVGWLERFLAASTDRDLNQHADRWGKEWSFPPEVLLATRELVRRLMGRASPVALTELHDLWPDGSPHFAFALACGRDALSASIPGAARRPTGTGTGHLAQHHQEAPPSETETTRNGHASARSLSPLSNGRHGLDPGRLRALSLSGFAATIMGSLPAPTRRLLQLWARCRSGWKTNSTLTPTTALIGRLHS